MLTAAEAPEALEDLKKKACSGRLYRFFDSFVYIRTNAQEILEDFDKIYWRFRRPELDAPAHGIQELFIITEPDAEKPKITVISEDEYQILENGPNPNLYLFIFSYIIPKVKSHFLVHAATLSHQNQATIIAAHSTTGKTTLAVELVKRGMNFLSDELAPIHRVTHRVDPFPRSIGLRNLALNHLEKISQNRISQAPNAKGEVKWMIDAEDLKGGSVARACPCKNVIFLEPQYEEELTYAPSELRRSGEEPQPEARQVVEVTFTRVDPSLLLAVQRISGVSHVEIVQDRLFPLLRFVTEKDATILQDVEECAKVYNSALVSVVHGKTRKPDFSLTPVLKPMSKFEGTFELAKMILNAHSEAALMEDFHGSPALLLSQLADITSSFEFYRLMVGRLDLMTQMVEELMKNGS